MPRTSSIAVKPQHRPTNGVGKKWQLFEYDDGIAFSSGDEDKYVRMSGDKSSKAITIKVAAAIVIFRLISWNPEPINEPGINDSHEDFRQ